MSNKVFKQTKYKSVFAAFQSQTLNIKKKFLAENLIYVNLLRYCCTVNKLLRD